MPLLKWETVGLPDKEAILRRLNTAAWFAFILVYLPPSHIISNIFRDTVWPFLARGEMIYTPDDFVRDVFQIASLIYAVTVLVSFHRTWADTTLRTALERHGVSRHRLINWFYWYLVSFIAMFALIHMEPDTANICKRPVKGVWRFWASGGWPV
ncbi:MAG: hypothetical protein H3C30_16550, partial [Candidatus Hydrogenedentes bacterium]|nr:hypothetical protein [Candidatus Hydrogenedentota bacterium]